MLLELEALEVGAIDCISASVGIAAFDRSMTPAQLMGKAAEALDRARAAGGGRVFVFSGERTTSEPEDDHHHAVTAALAASLLERDRYTGEHSESLIQMTEMVASGLGLGPDELKQVKTAALLHDIGKVGIPDHVLHKPTKLDEDEWALMKEHPVIGERILRAIPGLGGVARIVRHEHERWDGKGYPDGLEGEQIPIGSRIILACDAYHAMTSDRPYRAALPHSVAVEQLVEGAGTQFDPAVTEVLIGCLYSLRQANLSPA
jgi:HD-GYP domain-containing protein (c-di-GMP phosphodiesterase class II)